MDKTWQRKEEESDQAWEAFVIYRDLGATRSSQEVSNRTGKAHSLMRRWSSDHQWVDRAAAWDNHLDQERRRVFLSGQSEAVENLMRLATTMQQKAHAHFLLLDESEIRTPDAIRMSEAAVKITAAAAGIIDKANANSERDADKTVGIVELMLEVMKVKGSDRTDS
jgi:hypothetical protein